MNNYLLLLGNNISEVRQILNLTQEDLAHKMGVSRPTIVKLEQDPNRLTKTLAFAFFIAVSYEMNIRIKNVKNLNPKEYKNPDRLKKFIDEIKKSSLLPIGAISTAATFSLGGLIPGIGAIIASAAGATSILNSLKKKSPEDLKWDEEKAKKMIEEVQKKLLEDQRKIVVCFQLNALEIEQFVEKIDEGEITTEVW
ncbi:helix-turn-helix domain-containing protein [Peribacillus frigoritolerans]|uniref:helix-turn-helix transcriptional regulator n=1 Tax=Peribacillus frigoritolerans TaxID=450367 RepID=UPI003D285905